MKLSNNTILITGGSSGLGLEMASKLSKNNTVIICGRSPHRLLDVKQNHPSIATFQCDLSQKEECQRLADFVLKNHPDLNILVNNAAVVNRKAFFQSEDILTLCEEEVNINFLAPIRLLKMLQKPLEQNKNSAIINISSGLVYTPKRSYTFYNATKAALHSFTQTLRLQVQDSKIKVIEVLFPAVNTPWHQGKAPKIAISTTEAVTEMLYELEKGNQEIRIGKTKLLYLISRLAPKFALRKVNSLE